METIKKTKKDRTMASAKIGDGGAMILADEQPDGVHTNYRVRVFRWHAMALGAIDIHCLDSGAAMLIHLALLDACDITIA
ncbi:unnamed protein product [marine sediment metagenome]|uniref:Uncharacterized protein n=1 Tax=marine sediment metagenome TaxID=412755 RepID=X0X2B7_9ZZZZ